jgi:hypothetical protein
VVAALCYLFANRRALEDQLPANNEIHHPEGRKPRTLRAEGLFHGMRLHKTAVWICSCFVAENSLGST